MARFIGPLNAVNFLFVSTEKTVGNTVPGIASVGAIGLETDTGFYYIVKEDTSIQRYSLPFSASVDIGSVDQGTGGSSAWLVNTELPTAVSLTGTNAKAVTTPIIGAALLASDGTNLIEVDSTHQLPTITTGDGVIITGETVETGGSGILGWLSSIRHNIVAALTNFFTVGGKLTTVSVEFTRENNATPYLPGDVISASAGTPALLEIPGIFRNAGGSGYITLVRITNNVKSVTPRFRVHFFKASTVTIAGDNLPLIEKYADASKRLGFVDTLSSITGADATNSDMSRAMTDNCRHPVTAADGSTSLFVELETPDAVTLTSGSKCTIVITMDNN